MKRLIVFALITAVLSLIGSFPTPVHAQSPGGDLKPTFLSPTPGLYVNGWPPFTISYPKEWVVQPNIATEPFRVGVPGPAGPNPLPALLIGLSGNTADVGSAAKALVGFMTMLGFKEIKVLSDKPSTLQDGTPAQETELELIPPVPPNASKRNWFVLTTKKDGAWIQVTLVNDKGMIGEELKRIAYTLKVAQGTQEPVKLPPDVQAFIDKWNSDINSHDVARIVSNYSDRYRYNTADKAFTEGLFRNAPDSPVQLGITEASVTVTIFEPQGDKAYLAGFFGGKTKSGTPGGTPPINDNQIIKEDGQWKWYGNKK